MIKFAKKRFFTDPGSPIRTTYELKWSAKTGQQELFEKGKEDFQAEIQSHLESCDINVLIRRINAGETDLLTVNMGQYGDFTGLSMTPHELFQIRIDAKNTWSNLSKEQQALFGDFETFAETAGTDEWFKNLGVEFNENVKTEEVKEEKQDAGD